MGRRVAEARALAWEHVDLGDGSATPPRPASIAVWRSVRAHRDTKTPRSLRTLGLPAFATTALAELKEREGRTTEPGFATRDGGELDAANVRREFRAAINAAGIPDAWSPRELRHTFVSLMSDTGVPVEGNRPPRRPYQLPHHRDRLPAPAAPRHGKRRTGPRPAPRPHRVTDVFDMCHVTRYIDGL
jgi:integrase